MANVKTMRREQPFYLIPIVLGMAGVLYSRGLEDPVLKSIVVLLCVAVPMLVGGNLLARVRSSGGQKVLLWIGIVCLTLGAVVTVSGYSESLVAREMVSEEVGQWYIYIGSVSLLFGLAVLLYSLMRSEVLLDELTRQFSHVADHIGEGVIVTDYDGTIILANRAAIELSGLQEEEMVGRQAFKVAEELGMEAMARANAMRKQGVASEYEVDWDRDGERLQLWVRGSPVYDRKNRIVGTIATIRDTTELHRLRTRLEEYAEGLQKLVEDRTQKLRASEEQLRNLLLNMDEGFATIDHDGNVQFANERLISMLNVSHNRLLGKPLSHFVAIEDVSKVENALRRMEEDHLNRESYEINLMTDTGAYVPVQLSIAYITAADDDTEPTYALVLTDLRELKAAHQRLEHHAAELERANEELRELDRNKDLFLSNVSHELRTPLSTVQGYLEMWQDGHFGDIDAPQQGAIQTMSRNLERLLKMINEMIEFSRTEIRGVLLSETLFSPHTLVSEATASIQPHVMQKEMTINQFVEDGMPPIWADRGKLGQVLGILLSNAVKFSREGDMITIRAYREGADAVFQVIDSGIGIDPAYHDRIFRKFYQVDSSMTRHYQGTGIGLSIARRLVEAHGGRMWVVSEVKQGSTFTFALPNAVFQADFPADTSGEFEGAVALIANERSEFRFALAGILRQLGFTVMDYRTGYDLVQAASQLQPDIVFIDEGLPDVSGSDAADRIRQNMQTVDTPVILFRSTQFGERLEADSLYKGIHVLMKPFTVEELRACCLEELGRSDLPSRSIDAQIGK